jgi:N-acetyl-anhydromuramyl-L-alanine amidase AmpD
MHSRTLPVYCYSQRELIIEGVIIHFFSAKNVDYENKFSTPACRNLFKDLNRSKENREHYMKGPEWMSSRTYASAHLLIGRYGELWKLVPFNKRAWHAGHSSLNGRDNCNRWTLGIELVGDSESKFTDEQYISLSHFIADLQKRHQFPNKNIAGHDAVRHEYNQRLPRGAKRAANKVDPSGRSDGSGNNFDWDRLFAMIYAIKKGAYAPEVME